MNKFIFLDIDGVLNNLATLRATRDGFGLDPKCLLLLKDIVDKTGAKIVLSSTWRCFEKGRVALRRALRINGIPDIIGCTEDLRTDRKDEILKWIKDKKVDQINDRIAILDDEPDACLVPKWFFRTSFEGDGLTREIADDIITHLNS
jgi:hypothetical protein